MFTDMAAFLGSYERRPLSATADQLANSLRSWNVSRIFAGRIDHLRMDNTHSADLPESPMTFQGITVHTVPVIDPTIRTWQEQAELHLKAGNGRLPIIRLHPGHHGYRLTQTPSLEELVKWAHEHGTVIQIFVNLDDTRRQHAAGQIPDVPVNEIAKFADQFRHQPFLISGALFGALKSLDSNHPENLWADTARIEGGLAIPTLFDLGWRDRLVFASHAPILIAHSAIARVLTDINDSDANRIFQKNAENLLSLNN
ncbi:MAG: hypothetical protein RJA81_2469 [Planctomycetota bacterium]|jgi:predicted TIM-barrel fold metal-dependent hydrolase